MQIRIRNLFHQINEEQSLRINSWILPEGRSALICGPNGSGKSAFANILGSQVCITEGDIEFSHPGRQAHVSFDLEADILAEDRYHNDSEYTEGGLDHGRTAQEVIGPGDSLQSVVDLMGIAYLLERPFKAISTGESRKVLIARALLDDPELLILEEPFGGLDIASRQEMHSLINQLIDKGVQILLFDYYNDHLPDRLNHLLYFLGGQIVLEGPRKKVIELPEWEAYTSGQIRLPHHLPDSHCYDHLDPSTPFVQISDLDVAYDGKTVFKDLNWTFNRGENWRISGPNGSGKSTLLGMISGDNPKAYGQDITLFGVKRGSGESIWDIKRHFGIMSSALHRDYRAPGTILEVVVSGFFDSIGLYDKPTVAQWRIARGWIDLLGMQGKEKIPFSLLSFGEQRRVLIVRAMVKLPLILLLDEPCLGLDNNSRAQVMALIDYISSHSQTHILFVAHDYTDELTCLNRSLEFKSDGDCYRATPSELPVYE